MNDLHFNSHYIAHSLSKSTQTESLEESLSCNY